MTNDTNTLNGALRELGETMAANLTTQGVASTWDEGLTTLAGKILDITPGPTPSFDGISLTGDKNILSAADSEYVTLTAQLLDGQSSAAVEGETVSFKVYKSSDDSLVTTLTDDTNSSGVATVSYYGQGTGDIYIQAECTFVSETYVIEDCLLVKATHTETYNTTSVTFKHIYSMPSEMPVEISANIKSSVVVKFGLCLKEGNNSTNNQYIRVGAEGTYKGATITSTQYTQTNDTTSQASANVSYPIKITYNNGNITGYIDGDSVISHSKTFNPLYIMLLSWGGSKTVTVTDLKVKPL